MKALIVRNTNGNSGQVNATDSHRARKPGVHLKAEGPMESKTMSQARQNIVSSVIIY
jgi:hypothetical protein